MIQYPQAEKKLAVVLDERELSSITGDRAPIHDLKGLTACSSIAHFQAI